VQWSGADHDQLVGRSNRYPQSKLVFVYTMVARKTTDEMMVRVGGAKANLLGTFFDGEWLLHRIITPTYHISAEQMRCLLT
jgi:SNF2 family DNA or RNA helicase